MTCNPVQCVPHAAKMQIQRPRSLGHWLGLGLGCFTYWHHHFAKRRQTVKQNNCCQIYYTQRRALKAQAGENSKETQEKEKVEGEGEEEKGNTYSMAKNWAVSIFMGQARSNFNISINFWQFFCKLPATVRQTENVRGRGKRNWKRRNTFSINLLQLSGETMSLSRWRWRTSDL